MKLTAAKGERKNQSLDSTGAAEWPSLPLQDLEGDI